MVCLRKGHTLKVNRYALLYVLQLQCCTIIVVIPSYHHTTISSKR
jgi:hypothetical protein